MVREITLRLTKEDAVELAYLSAAVGFAPEAAAVYAVRLVSACVREGLIDDVPARAWPKEAQPLVDGGARVLEMPQRKSAAQGD